MVEPWTIRNLAWALTTCLEVVLLCYLLGRNLFRRHPAFCFYIFATLLQSVSGAWASHHWGGQSMEFFNIAWGTQLVIICARWFAVIEIARRVLASHSGVWKLASTVLFVLCLVILSYSVVIPRTRWYLSVLSADRAVEFCIAAFIVALLLFARYYRLEMTHLERQLSIGFCLYSCSWVVSNTLYQGSPHPSGMWWEFFEILAFFATLVLWINAVRSPVQIPLPATIPRLSAERYAEVSQQLNERLNSLNERLNQLFRRGDARL